MSDILFSGPRHRDIDYTPETSLEETIKRTKKSALAWDRSRRQAKYYRDAERLLALQATAATNDADHVQLVRSALTETQSDFRTIDSLARQLRMSRQDVVSSIQKLGHDVRRPVHQKSGEAELYRWAARGLTSRERIRGLIAIVARDGN